MEYDSNPSAFLDYRMLMRKKVERVLLVASEYDAFIVQEDGGFEDQVHAKYLELLLTTPPRFHTVMSPADAYRELEEGRYELVITTPHLAGSNPFRLAEGIKRRWPDLPVFMFAYDAVTARQYADLGRPSAVDQVFLWKGDPEVLMAMVKLVEDRMNLDDDTTIGNVRVIIVVEDSPDYYSFYLPLIFREAMKLTRSLLSGRLNAVDRAYRIRTRPKILLARTFEEASTLYQQHREKVQAVVTDLSFPRRGHEDSQAGAALIRAIHEDLPDIPILLQSADEGARGLAESLGVAFAEKSAGDLADRLRRFLLENAGFGPFVFRDPVDGNELATVHDLHEMALVLRTIPAASLAWHATRNQISIWFNARSEFAIAREMRPLTIRDFKDVEDIRTYLGHYLRDFMQKQQQGQVVEFVRGLDHLARDFSRLGTGSMGGKARGVAFLGRMLARNTALHEQFPGIRIRTPHTTVLCTDLFDDFCNRYNLRSRALEVDDDDFVSSLFLSYELNDSLIADLADLLDVVTFPLAVRSSSLSEDSEYQPLAGMYRTCEIPNNSPSHQERLHQLSVAIRLVWASTFYRGPRRFLEDTAQQHGEERMAVIIQQLVGLNRANGDRFYPNFSGTAQSYNYYPLRQIRQEDGFASVALGLGRMVVEGGKALRFSPKHPQILVEMPSATEALRNSQQRFYALDLRPGPAGCVGSEGVRLLKLGLSEAESDGTLAPVGATYDPDNDRIYDTLFREGLRLVNFAPMLKHSRFPLAPIIERVLESCATGLGTAVEIEFAGNVAPDRGGEFVLLQCRPLVAHPAALDVDIGVHDETEILVFRGQALGNGAITDIRDVVYVHPRRFNLARTRQMAQDIGRINEKLVCEGRRALFIGPGRWGTADPCLGIPVEWHAVSSARAFVEMGIAGFRVDPSQGSHFFHNITSLQVGYFTLDLTRGDDVLDLEWLESSEALDETDLVRHVRLPSPMVIRIDGRLGKGVGVRGA